MRFRTILTVAAASAAAWGGGTASAAAAVTAPAPRVSTAPVAGPLSALTAISGISVLRGFSVAGLRLMP